MSDIFYLTGAEIRTLNDCFPLLIDTSRIRNPKFPYRIQVKSSRAFACDDKEHNEQIDRCPFDLPDKELYAISETAFKKLMGSLCSMLIFNTLEMGQIFADKKESKGDYSGLQDSLRLTAECIDTMMNAVQTEPFAEGYVLPVPKD